MQVNGRVLCCLVGVVLLPTIALGSGYPTFVVPDKAFLLRNKYIETSHCGAGQGRLKAHGVINIHDNLCKSFCPEDWSWVIQGDNQCHDLRDGFEFKGVKITHVPGVSGQTNYSVVAADFGKEVGGFKLVMTTKAQEYWHCYEMNSELKLIACTNDM